MGFALYFVGATIGRPLDSSEFQTGDQWSPLHNKQFIEFALCSIYYLFYIIFGILSNFFAVCIIKNKKGNPLNIKGFPVSLNKIIKKAFFSCLFSIFSNLFGSLFLIHCITFGKSFCFLAVNFGLLSFFLFFIRFFR